jgi:hypothetical protein
MKLSELFIHFVNHPMEQRKSWQNQFARCYKQSNCTRTVCRPDSWLEVRMYPEGPAIGHLTQISVIFLGHTANVELLKSTLHFMLHKQPSSILIPKFSLRRALSTR